MYDIVLLQPEDPILKKALNAIISGNAAIPGPQGNYRLFLPGEQCIQFGNGGTGAHVVVVVAHGSSNSLSGYSSWSAFKDDARGADWAGMTTLYISACKAEGDGGGAFYKGNIAGQAKFAFPNATVWASTSNVHASTQMGDWQKL